MLSAVIHDMFAFLVIFFFGITAFADAFGSIEYILILNGHVSSNPGAKWDADTFYEKYIQSYVNQW